MLLANKDADKKTKVVGTVVAAIFLAISGLASYDWNPVSEEGKAQAESTLGDTSVYWTQFGSVYHLDTECQHLNRSSELFEGDVATAIEKGKTRLCKTCAKNFNIEIADNGAILTTTPLTAAVEKVVEDVAEEPAA